MIHKIHEWSPIRSGKARYQKDSHQMSKERYAIIKIEVCWSELDKQQSTAEGRFNQNRSLLIRVGQTTIHRWDRISLTNQIFNQAHVPPFPFSLFFFPLQNLGEEVEVHNLSCSNLINLQKKKKYHISVMFHWFKMVHASKWTCHLIHF